MNSAVSIQLDSLVQNPIDKFLPQAVSEALLCYSDFPIQTSIHSSAYQQVFFSNLHCCFRILVVLNYWQIATVHCCNEMQQFSMQEIEFEHLKSLDSNLVCFLPYQGKSPSHLRSLE